MKILICKSDCKLVWSNSSFQKVWSNSLVIIHGRKVNTKQNKTKLLVILYNTIPSWATIEFNLLRSIWHKTRRFSRPRRVGKHQFFKLFSTRELEHNSSWECSWMMVTQEVRSCSYQAVTVFKKWKKESKCSGATGDQMKVIVSYSCLASATKILPDSHHPATTSVLAHCGMHTQCDRQKI